MNVPTTTNGTPAAAFRIEPKSLADSAVYVRMNTRGSAVAMQPVATEITDQSGLQTIDDFINSLPAP